MPSVSLSVLKDSLVTLLGTPGEKRGHGASEGDGFQSLLDIGSTPNVIEPSAVRAVERPKNERLEPIINNHDEDVRDTVPAPVEVPARVLSERRAQKPERHDAHRVDAPGKKIPAATQDDAAASTTIEPRRDTQEEVAATGMPEESDPVAVPLDVPQPVGEQRDMLLGQVRMHIENLSAMLQGIIKFMEAAKTNASVTVETSVTSVSFAAFWQQGSGSKTIAASEPGVPSLPAAPSAIASIAQLEPVFTAPGALTEIAGVKNEEYMSPTKPVSDLPTGALKNLLSIFKQLSTLMPQGGANVLPDHFHPSGIANREDFPKLLEVLKANVQLLQDWLKNNPQPVGGTVLPSGAPASHYDQISAFIKGGLNLIKILSGEVKADAAIIPAIDTKPLADKPLLPVLPTMKEAGAAVNNVMPKPVAVGGEVASLPAFPAARQDTPEKHIIQNTQTLAQPNIITETAVREPAHANGNLSGGNQGGHNGNASAQLLGIQQPGSPQQANNAGGATFARLLNHPSPMPVADQVAVHIKTAVADGSSKIHIQLDPAELGKLDIRMHVGADGKTGVVITADNKTTLDLLQRDIRGLEQALSDAGLKTDSGSLSFNLRGGQQQERDSLHASYPYAKMKEEEELLPVAAISRSYVVNLSEGLDIKI